MTLNWAKGEHCAAELGVFDAHCRLSLCQSIKSHKPWSTKISTTSAWQTHIDYRVTMKDTSAHEHLPFSENCAPAHLTIFENYVSYWYINCFVMDVAAKSRHSATQCKTSRSAAGTALLCNTVLRKTLGSVYTPKIWGVFHKIWQNIKDWYFILWPHLLSNKYFAEYLNVYEVTFVYDIYTFSI